MIKITYKRQSVLEGTRFNLTVDGHADFDEKGKDIVCAGVSSLVMALYGKLVTLDEDKKATSDFDIKDGYVKFSTLSPVYTDMLVTESAYDTVICGFMRLHEQYPANVSEVEIC